MAPIVIDLGKADDQRDVVHRAVQALAEGKLVVFPTETVYGLAASALQADAVNALLDAKGRASGHPLALAIRSGDDALDYAPDMSTLARRLARRCWPGPFTMVLSDEHPDSATKQLPEVVQQAVSPAGTVGLRVPGHPFVLSVLKMLPGPLVLTSANQSGQPDAVSSDQAVRALGDKVAFVFDDGQCKYAQPSSVVKVTGDRFEVLRSGVLSDNALRHLANMIILFTCTGNTCRSPMAAALMRQRLAAKLQCSIDDLEQQGVMVLSAGIAAMAGGRASTHAVETMKTLGLDLSQHESQPITDRLVRFADIILTMTHGHWDAIVRHWPDVQARTHMLCQDGADVSDPIGGPLEAYASCADQIDAWLERWTDELGLTFPE